MDGDQIEASVAVAKAHQDESLMGIEQAIAEREKAIAEREHVADRYHVTTETEHESAKIAGGERQVGKDQKVALPVASASLRSVVWKGQPVITLDPDWRFKLDPKAIRPRVTTAPKREVYQKVLGVDGIKFLPITP